MQLPCARIVLGFLYAHCRCLPHDRVDYLAGFAARNREPPADHTYYPIARHVASRFNLRDARDAKEGLCDDLKVTSIRSRFASDKIKRGDPAKEQFRRGPPRYARLLLGLRMGVSSLARGVFHDRIEHCRGCDRTVERGRHELDHADPNQPVNAVAHLMSCPNFAQYRLQAFGAETALTPTALWDPRAIRYVQLIRDNHPGL